MKRSARAGHKPEKVMCAIIACAIRFMIDLLGG
jgi:hypothetical protein